jgi:pentatricopeptide repeat protein
MMKKLIMGLLMLASITANAAPEVGDKINIVKNTIFCEDSRDLMTLMGYIKNGQPEKAEQLLVDAKTSGCSFVKTNKAAGTVFTVQDVSSSNIGQVVGLTSDTYNKIYFLLIKDGQYTKFTSAPTPQPRSAKPFPDVSSDITLSSNTVICESEKILINYVNAMVMGDMAQVREILHNDEVGQNCYVIKGEETEIPFHVEDVYKVGLFNISRIKVSVRDTPVFVHFVSKDEYTVINP